MHKGIFITKFRWAVYVLFIASLAFVAICTAVGIISNLFWRYSDDPQSIADPEFPNEFTSQQARYCLISLQALKKELFQQEQVMLSLTTNRRSGKTQWKTWSADWQQRFHQLGVNCKLTLHSYEKYPSLGVLAEIYRLLFYYQQLHSELIHRFVNQSVQQSSELELLMQRAQNMIDQYEIEALSPKP